VSTRPTRVVDLRSDTVTVATPAMRRAMAEAIVGDDVYGEDPTVRRLEELAAALVGKDAALFVPTGTMGNAVAVMTHTQRGDEVIVEATAHIYDAEVGGLAALSGAQARTLSGTHGRLDPAAVAAAIRADDVHFARTGLLCLENPHNAAGGTVTRPEDLAALCAAAHDRGVPVHLDGARLFNAAVALGIEAREVAAPADSVMFCLSKGLGAPVGSLLAGTTPFIAEARRRRKLLGGGMRQAGHLAAAGIVALEQMVDRLAEDHEHALLLARNLVGFSGLHVDMDAVETNMVYADLVVADAASAADPAREASPAARLVAALDRRGVRINAVSERRVRFVTHFGVDRDGIQETIRATQESLL
jgi:threonine aldolase